MSDTVGFQPESMDFTNLYNTVLEGNEEAIFNDWVRSNSKRLKKDLSKDLSDYDLKGYFKKLVMTGEASPFLEGHLPDTFKKPNHPTFSKDSFYSSDFLPGGLWDEKGNFHPSNWNLRLRSKEELQNYFLKTEPKAKLIFDVAKGDKR